ncbi:MAG TPA: nitroreductase family protein [Roseiflexaceae bacterium]|nr:nitroreductase family protein [Roseiflexaceae bacterium]
MTTLLPLTPDELLTTTRSVRKRLDLTRPVEDHLIEECISVAQQAPTGSNLQGWQFVVVRDAAKRAALADMYRRSWEVYINGPNAVVKHGGEDPERVATQMRVGASAQYLTDHLHEVPVYIIPCIFPRPERMDFATQAAIWGSILPAAWSLMLAGRARGLGSAWTTLHLVYEREAAELLGIPYEQVAQTCLLPFAHTIGTDFKPGPRAPLASIIHWDQW